MEDFRSRYSHRQRSRDSLERKMDNWIQTGRQVVDGVAGNRPGQRRGQKQDYSSRSSIDNLGRWVGEKVDWFFEDEEDWLDQNEFEQSSNTERILHDYKKPLTAISRRGIKSISPEKNYQQINDNDELWPDQSSFKVERWQRKGNLTEESVRDNDHSKLSSNFKKRQLPKSSRNKGSIS